MKQTLFVLLVSITLSPRAAKCQTYEGFDYSTNGNAITITRYTGLGGSVVIPSFINSMPVTSIAAYAFYNQSSLTNISIANSITNIGNFAFAGCESISNVTIPNSVTSIGSWAFSYFYGVTNLTLGSGVVSIGDYAFAFSGAGLTGVTIPSNVLKIGRSPFVNSDWLKAISVDTGNPAYASVDGILFDKSETALIDYPAAKTETSYTIQGSVTNIGDSAFSDALILTNVSIPNTVTSLGNSAFSWCSRLTGLTIPNSVGSIGASAFFNCFNLTSVTIPNGVSSIEAGTFDGCGLTSVAIPNSVTNIGGFAFSGCIDLVNATIPTNVVSIGDDAFETCFKLGNVIIPGSVITIGDLAFEACFNLTNVTIGKGVTAIGDQVFSDCQDLLAIDVDPANMSFSSLDGVLFDKNQNRLIQYPGGKKGSYSIPNSVTAIADYAFAFSTNLITSTIPNSVTNIEDAAFRNCNNLTSIFFQGDAPTITYAFTSDTNLTVYFRSGTSGWSSPYGGATALLWNPMVRAFGVQNGGFNFDIVGPTNLPIVVEASTNLSDASWVLLRNSTLTNGLLHFSDALFPSYPTRFYRIREP
jgi:BspA type Leucine rich repeat region (6 copies)